LRQAARRFAQIHDDLKRRGGAKPLPAQNARS
jgi:hypothetical protein